MKENTLFDYSLGCVGILLILIAITVLSFNVYFTVKRVQADNKRIELLQERDK